MAEIRFDKQSPYFTLWCKNAFTIPENEKNVVDDITTQCSNIAKTYKRAQVDVNPATASDLIDTFNEIQTKLPVEQGEEVPTSYNTIGELVSALDTYVADKNLEVQ